MKTPSNDLFLIIQSLSSTEKRQFKAQYQQESRTLDLFELMAGMAEYDEQRVKEQLNDASFVKNLKVHKVRLEQQVMSFLRQNKTEKSLGERLREQIDYLEILFERKLYTQAFDLAAKLEKQAKAQEEYEHLLIILSMKTRQQVYMQPKLANNSIEEIENCLAVISNYTYYAKISNQINTLSISADPKHEAQMLQVVASQIVEKGDEVAALSDIAARMRNHSLAIWRRRHKDLEGACDYTRANINICQANPKLYKEKPAPYFNILINHIISCGLAKKYDEALSYIKLLKEVADNNSTLEPHLIYAYSQAILAYKSKQEYKEAFVFFNTVAEPNLQKYNLTGLHTGQLMYISMMDIALIIGDKAAQKQWIELLRPLIQDLEHRLTEYALLCEMILYIEAKEWQVLGHWVEALQKRIQRHNIKLPLLRLVLNFAKKYASQPPNFSALLATHQAQFEQLIAAQPEYYRDFNKYFNYTNWLERQLLVADKKNKIKNKAF
jgi:hypothetical protein